MKTIDTQYKLLPFNFCRLNGKELIVNEVGDFLFCSEGTVKQILERNLSRSSILYKNLLAKYIITEDYNTHVIDILATRLRTKKSFLENFTVLHIFVLTLRCNQKCIYCQAASHNKECYNKDMKVEDLDRAIKLMLQTPSPHITMEFQGGESSLVPQLVEHAILETERQNVFFKKEIKYVLCTNLINVSNELLALCEKYNIFISTSLDGPEWLHDKNRGVKSSYRDFVKSLHYIKNRIDISQISPLMTTSSFSLNYPKEIIDAYRELGFHYIFLRPLNPYGRARTNEDWYSYYKRFLSFYKTALDYIISLNERGVFFVEGFTAMLMKKILSPFPVGFVDLQSPAGIINSVVVYNYDGYVYCSDESRMMAEYGDYTFRLGKVDEPYIELFYGKKAQQISKIWATEYIAGCSDCAFMQYCGADPVRNHSMQEDMYGHRPTSLFCMFHKEIFNYLFEMIDKRKEDILSLFRKWVYEK